MPSSPFETSSPHYTLAQPMGQEFIFLPLSSSTIGRSDGSFLLEENAKKQKRVADA
jgi:hypothetical protein